MQNVPFLPDINGDGMSDLVYEKTTGDPYQIFTRLNTGSGFGDESFSYLVLDDLRLVRFADVNDDGLDDALAPTGSGGTNQAHYSDGTTFGGSGGGGFGGPWGFAASAYVADVTGDGRRDMLLRNSSTGYWSIYANVAELKTVTTFWDGMGNWQKVTYLPLTALTYFSNGIAASLPYNRQYRGPLYVVDHHEANSGIQLDSYSYAAGVDGDSFVVQYGYWDALVDNRGRGFLGFGTFRTIDVRNGHFIDHDFFHEFPSTGWPKYSIRRRTSNSQYIAVYDPYEPVADLLGPGRYFVHIDDEIVQEYEVGGTYAEQLIRTISRNREYDATSGAVSEEITTTQPHSGDTHVTEVNTTLENSGNCLGLPGYVSVTRTQGVTSQTREVDNQFTACHIEYSIDLSEANQSRQLKTSLTYDVYGNVKTITLNSANGLTPSGQPVSPRVTEFFYDAPNHPGHLPSSIRRHINGEYAHKEFFTWDYDLILPLSHKDTEVDGRITYFQYDNFGRLKELTRPDGSIRTFYRTIDYIDYFDSNIEGTAFSDSDGNVEWTFLDSFGRRVGYQKKLISNWTRISAMRWFYDQAGTLDKQTQPFIWFENEYLIDYTHDILGRLTVEDRPVSELQSTGATTTVYYNRLSTVVVAPGNSSTQETAYVRDAIGRITSVIDASGKVSQYQYNPFDQLEKAIDPGNHQVDPVYNNRGDKIEMFDPDMGHWYFDYTVFGELAWQKDAKNQEVTYTYDQLGRLTSRTEPEFAAPNNKTVFSFYDSYDHWHGLPKSEESPPVDGFKREYQYDAKRRLSQEKTTIPGTSAYTTDFSYYGSGSGVGKLQTITYPTSTSGVRVNVDYQYDSVGQLFKVLTCTISPCVTFYEVGSMDALQRETYALLGNGVTETRVYDRANLLLKSIQSNPSSLQNLQYEWYPSGNLHVRDDNAHGREDVFTYDDVNRLLTQTMNGGNVLTMTYKADGDGNISSKSDVGSYVAYGGSSGGPHAVTQITGLQSNTYAYDLNGNMTNRDGDTITWYSHNLPKRINYGPSYSDFWYGPDRARYKQLTSSNIETHYLGAHFERENRDGLLIYRHNILAGGQAVAQYERRSDGDRIYYLHRDHQGSVVATSNGTSATEHQRWEYESYGRRWLRAGTAPDDTERGYTGHEHLDSVDSIHMNGRVQDPNIGRFMSADPFVQAPYFSQSLNRYSYAWNNPTTLVDPSGFQNGKVTQVDASAPGFRSVNCSAGRSCDDVMDSIVAIGFGFSSGVGVGEEFFRGAGDMNGRGVLQSPQGQQLLRPFLDYLAERDELLNQRGLAETVAAFGESPETFRWMIDQQIRDLDRAFECKHFDCGIEAVAPELYFAGVPAVTRALAGHVAAARGAALASGAGGEVLPMTIVRTLPPGTAGGVVNEARALTFATGNEHALVRLATGERALVSGGPGGIAFGEGQVTRIIGHTHPYGFGSIGPSAADAAALRALGQTHSYVLDGAGNIIRFGPK
jgi:RHS repeat-associated protein